MADDIAMQPLVRSTPVATSNGPVCGYEEDRLKVSRAYVMGPHPPAR